MRFWVWILTVSWKLKWSSGDALLINYFRKAPAWNPVWSNHETWRKLGNGKGILGLGEGEVGILFCGFISLLYSGFFFSVFPCCGRESRVFLLRLC
jgi:hypothetical protein